MNKEKEIEKINKHIQDLVYEKIQLKKAYNYYHCQRDAEQFRHIEDNYGVGVPTSISFTPLIKKHIDVLVGEYLELDPELQISCKDEETVSNIMRDKKIKIDTELYNTLKKYLHNTVLSIFFENQQVTNDPYIEKELIKIKKNIDKSFISDYELAAQNILSYIKNSRDIDMKNKFRELFTDLLITGICYYRIKPSGGKNNIKFEVLNPLHTFIERNRYEFYLNKSSRAVIRKYMNKEEILREFGDELSNDAIKRLEDNIGKGERNLNTVFVRSHGALDVDGNGGTVTRQVPTPGILGGLEVTPIFPWDHSGMYNYQNNPVITVYEVEWLEFDKKNDRLTRHEGVKIGEDIYITRGESENIIRSQSNPKECTLSINGMFFLDKNGSPFSIVLSTIDLQDKYDLLMYYRDNLIATSGTVGDWIDLASIPTSLGADMPERIVKWIAYKKNGVALFDSSQEGAALLNTTFNGYDDTVKAQAVQAIQLSIDSIELQAAAITGVFPEKLGGIAERDAVSNVKVGLKYSTLLTKQYFYAMDLMYKEANYDSLNVARIVYKNGIVGTIILGHKRVETFTALPQHYTLTDYDLHIQDSTETLQARETIKMLNVELIKAGQADPEMIVNIVLSKNLTELKRYIEESMATKREENNQLNTLQEQLNQLDQQRQQLEQQVKQLSSENQSLQSRIERNNEAQIELEKKRVELEEKKMRNDKDTDDNTLKLKREQINVEYLQMSDNNPHNDKIKNVV